MLNKIFSRLLYCFCCKSQDNTTYDSDDELMNDTDSI